MTIVSTSTYTGSGAPSAAPAAAPAAPAPAESGALVAPAAAPVAAPAVAAPAATPVEPAVAPAPLSLEVEPAKPAASSADTPAADDSKGVSYEKTGDAGLDMALSFLGRNGYGPDHPAMKAAAEGNFALLKADLATKNPTGWAEHLALGEASYKAQNEARAAKAKADREGILKVVGGEKEWAAIQGWAAKNAEPEERATIGAALQAGGIVARAVASYLGQQYANAAGTTMEPAGVSRPGAQGAPGAKGPLSGPEYRAAIAELKSRVGPSGVDGSPEYASLQARYRAYRG